MGVIFHSHFFFAPEKQSYRVGVKTHEKNRDLHLCNYLVIIMLHYTFASFPKDAGTTTLLEEAARPVIWRPLGGKKVKRWN